MAFFIKKTLLQFVSAVSHGLYFCVGLVAGVFAATIAKAAGAADRLLLRHVLGPFYKALWRAKRKIKELSGVEGASDTASFAYILVLFLLVVIIVFLSWTNVIRAGFLSDEDTNNRLLIFSIDSGDFGEEDLVLETSEATDSVTASESYLGNEPILDYANVAAGIPIDCDECQEPPTAMGDTAFVPPALSLVESKDGKKVRRQLEEYVVQKGDVIASLAKKFSINVNTLMWANNLSSWSVLKIGQKLIIPPTDGLLHKLAKGDSLDKIAQKYKVDKSQILAYNDINEGDTLSVGKQLVIPGAKKQTVVAPYPYTPPQVILIPPTVVGSWGLVWPASTKRITQTYKYRHSAIDIGAPMGSPIYAIFDGVVEYSGWGTGYGRQVILNHGNGMRTRYGHASKLLVVKGQSVAKGQTIALVGSSGWSTGPHLHFELYWNGRKVNPLQYLR